MVSVRFVFASTALACVSSAFNAVFATSAAKTAATVRCAAPAVGTEAPATTTTAEELLGANAALLDPSQLALVSVLVANGQRSLFEAWPAPGTEDEGKRRLVAALEKVDASYTGGLVAYIGKSRELLEDSAVGANPFEGYTPSVPDGETLNYGSPGFQQAEEAGLEAASGVGFVLVAGGLGERLGYEGIKLELPVEAATGTSFLELYCQYILALQDRVRARTGDATQVVPLAIMTSDDTDAPTRKLLESHDNFGLVAPGQLTIMKQDKVAALADGTALLAVEGKWDLVTKPHGHGDVHSLMRTSGVAKAWLEDRKLTHVFFFQDTNALVLNAVLPALGVSAKRHFVYNSVCIPRRANEAAGAITLLRHADPAKELVINVEYNQLDPLLKASGSGDVNDPTTGFSPYPGNANVLVLALPEYVAVLEGEAKGVVDEFVNPKYADAAKCRFKKPTRLECMMQDFPKLLKREVPEAAVGFTTFERWLAFSPAKNALAEARGLAAKQEPPGCSASAEFDVYAAHARRLTSSKGLSSSPASSFELAGVAGLYAGPRVILVPSFALTSSEVDAKVRGPVNLADGTLLVVDGANVEFAGALDVQSGALVIKNPRPDAKLVVEDLVVNNGGLAFLSMTDAEVAAAGPIERVRGYRAVPAADLLTVEITEPGHFVLNNAGLKKVKDEL